MNPALTISTLRTGFAASAVIALLAMGCGSDDEATPPVTTPNAASAQGQSCTRTDDCIEGLACVGNVCGGSAETPPESPRGGAGESCTRRADCDEGLGCFDQRCAETTESTSARLGGLGETCSAPTDCLTTLTCVPDPAYGIGVCDVANHELEPSGKVCGAECKQAADCFALPIATQNQLSAQLGLLGSSVRSCADLARVIEAGDRCNPANAAPLNRQLCFAQATYCTTSNAWSCNAGQCSYTAACGDSGEVPNGCPSRTRTGRPLPTSCIANRCQSAAPGSVCITNASCDGKTVSDDPNADTCATGECTCFEQTACYRKCRRDLDCRSGKTCDVTAGLCVAPPACTSNAQCATQLGNVTATCQEGRCKVPCTTDRQCSPSGARPGESFNGRVCSAGFCEPLGCQSDQECSVSSEGVSLRTFCTEPAGAASTHPESAVTSGPQ